MSPVARPSRNSEYKRVGTNLPHALHEYKELFTHDIEPSTAHRIGRLSALQQSLHEQLGSLEEQQSQERVTNQRSLKKEMQQMQTRLLQESVSALFWSALGRLMFLFLD